MTYRDEQYRACESFAEGRCDLRSDLLYGDDDKTGRVDGVEWVGVVKINCFLVWISLKEKMRCLMELKGVCAAIAETVPAGIKFESIEVQARSFFYRIEDVAGG